MGPVPYITEDKGNLFCVYDGPSPEAARTNAQKNELPVDRIARVTVLDPYAYYQGGLGRARQRPPTLQPLHTKRVNQKYASKAVSREAGYGLLKDAAGIECIADSMGGMGIHLVNGRMVSDSSVVAPSLAITRCTL